VVVALRDATCSEQSDGGQANDLGSLFEIGLRLRNTGEENATLDPHGVFLRVGATDIGPADASHLITVLPGFSQDVNLRFRGRNMTICSQPVMLVLDQAFAPGTTRRQEYLISFRARTAPTAGGVATQQLR
jgi:hypothetical protein